MTTANDAMACDTIDGIANANSKNASPQDKINSTPSASGPCLKVAKGTRTTIAAAGAGPGFKALCVALEGHPGCLWMAKAAFGAADQQQ